jgi:hypothetical protein
VQESEFPKKVDVPTINLEIEKTNLNDTVENGNYDINYILQARSSNSRSVLSNGLKNQLEAMETHR